jgi:hypothetical protein
MQPTLHQNLVATQVDRLGHLCQQLGAWQHVTFIAFGPSIKSAEVAHRCADVCVIDVSIDVVRSIVFRMQSPSDRIGGRTDGGQLIALQQRQCIVSRQTMSGNRAIKN